MIEYPAVATSVRPAREAVVKLAERYGADEECLERVRLAVSEAATNVVLHAYPGGTGRFRLFVEVDSAHLRVIVQDDGAGLDTVSENPGLGAGRSIMAQVAVDARFLERAVKGSAVELRFAL